MTTPTTARRPGRPRSFDEDVVLLQILDAFWERGYDATSMADLVRVTSVNSPSLYATFGNKEQIFMRAVELYVRLNGASSGRMLRTHARFLDAMKALFDSQLDLFTRYDPPRGCLVVKSFSDAASVSDAARDQLRRYREGTGVAIRERVQRAVDEGELPADEDVGALSDMYHNFLNGLTVQITDGVSAARLRAAITRLCAASI